MLVKCDVLINELDNNRKVYRIPGMESKFVDNVEFLPVFEDPKRPKLQWVRKDAYVKSHTTGVHIDA